MEVVGGGDESADSFRFGSRQKAAFGIERLVVMGGDRDGMGYSNRRSGTIDKS